MAYFKGAFPLWVVGFGAIALLYAAGETQRRDKQPKLPELKPAQFPMLIAGVALLVFWFVLYGSKIFQNLQIVFADPPLIITGTITVPVVAFVLIKWYTRGKKIAIV